MDLIDVEEGLRRHLADRGDDLAPAPRDLAERTRSRHRRQRRRQAGAAGAVLAVALVFGGIPVLRGMLPDTGTSGDAAAPSSAAPLPSLYDLPARGSLAGDEEWLAAVAALPWTAVQLADPDTDPPVESHRVVYAADVPGARVALVMGRERAVLSATWFTGPAGAEPAEMTQALTAERTFPDQPLTLLDAAAPTGPATLTVVSRPGDEAEYTQGLLVSADGDTTEDVVDLELTDGAGAVSVARPGIYLGTSEVRIDRDGERAYGVYPSASDRLVDSTFDAPVDVADPRGLRPGIAEDWLRGLAASALSRYGSGAAGVTPVLLAAGPVPGERDPHVAMVGLTFPSGATTAWAVRYSGTGDASTGTTTSLTPLPAAAPLLDRVLGVRVEDALAVSGPASAATAEALAADGSVVARFPVVDGSAVAGLPATSVVTEVRVLDPAGAVVDQVRVTGGL